MLAQLDTMRQSLAGERSFFSQPNIVSDIQYLTAYWHMKESDRVAARAYCTRSAKKSWLIRKNLKKL